MQGTLDLEEGSITVIADSPIPEIMLMAEGQKRKEKGMKGVLHQRPVFKELAAKIIEGFVTKGESITAERIQIEFMAKYPQCPWPHPNAWGAVINAAAKRGLIRKTGRYIPAIKPASHGREIRVWEPAS